MRRSARLALTVSVLATVACVGDSANPTPDSGTADSGIDTGTKSDAEVDSGQAFTIGGVVHFLQAAGGDAGVGLELVNNGSDAVKVTSAGSFSFPTKASAYDVTVKTNPPGQVCSVRSGGKGTATADVSTIVVGCTLARQSSGGTANVTTTSKTFVAIPGVAPIAFTSDVAGKALVSLMLPSVALNNGSYDQVASAIELDGNVVATAWFGNQNNIGQGGHTVYGIVDVPAGAHTLAAKWRTQLNAGNNLITAYAPFAIQLDLVMLDSLSNYVSTAHGSGAATLTNTSSTAAPMMADVAFSVAQAAPVLALFQAPWTVVGVGNPVISSLSFGLSADSAPLSTARINATSQDTAPLLVGLTPLGVGAHALKASWANPTPTVAGTSKVAPQMDAIVFSPAAKTASSQVAGDRTTNQSTFVTIPGLSPITIAPTVATMALVIFHTDASAGGSDKYAGGEFSVALDNASVGGIGAITSSLAGSAYPLTFIQLVPVSAGSHTLQAQFRSTNLDLHTGATASLSAIVLE